MSLIRSGSLVKMACDWPDCLAVAVVEGVVISDTALHLPARVQPPGGWLSIQVSGRQSESFDACGLRHAVNVFVKRGAICT